MNNIDTKAIDKLFEKLQAQGENVKTLPTAIYARKSTKDESEVSLAGQIDACRKFIEEDSRLQLVEKVYSEDNKSGYTISTRKEIQSLISEVKAGDVRVIVAYNLTRISRNVVDGENLDNLLRKYGAIVLYATESFESNANGNFFKRIERVCAQRLPESSAELTMRSHIANAKLSRTNGGRTPYGYKTVGRKYVKEPQEAKAVKFMFREIIAGKNIPTIIEELTASGIKTRDGNPFSYNTVYRMLTNEKYTGVYIYNKTDGRKRKDRILTEDFEEVRNEGGIPQIVSKKTFNAAQITLKGTCLKRAKKVVNSYVLTGYLKCGICGEFMHGESSYGRNSNKYTQYKCKRGSSCKNGIKQDLIESNCACVIASILQRFCQEDRMKSALQKCLQSTKSEYSSLVQMIKIEEKDKKSLIAALANSTSDEVSKEITESIQKTNDEIASLKCKKDSLAASIKNSGAVIDKIVGPNFTLSSTEIKQDARVFSSLVALLIKDITLTGTEVVFNLVDYSK